jgi:competence protein ComEA
VGYQLRGHEVALRAEAVSNPRAPSNRSGTLSLELWAAPQGCERTPETGGGVCLAAAQLEPIAGGESARELECRAVFQEPPPGLFTLQLLLREWTQAFGYLTRDRRSFELPYRVQSKPAARSPESVPPAPLARSRVVSIQTASVEELARVKGLNLKIAKEIVKARPFASVDDLLRVHGIGRKTLDKIRGWIAL